MLCLVEEADIEDDAGNVIKEVYVQPVVPLEFHTGYRLASAIPDIFSDGGKMIRMAGYIPGCGLKSPYQCTGQLQGSADHLPVDTSTNSRRICTQDLSLTTLHPHFKVQPAFQVPTIQGTNIINSGGNPKHSLPQWLGAYCKVHMNTSSFLGYIAFIYILQELSQNSACPTPTIIMDQ